MVNNLKISVVIPTYKACDTICNVVSRIQSCVDKIYIIDDACPNSSGFHVEKHCKDTRVSVLKNQLNLGVGGATIRGYIEALKDGCNIVVKMDSDGQMNPEDLMKIMEPLLSGRADYAKGNRFYNIEDLVEMPRIRVFGNAILSLMCKVSSGHWHIFDPTNGYTAIHSTALQLLPLNKIEMRYEFETDILYHLGLIRGVVEDVPIKAQYRDEQSGIIIKKEIINFFKLHIKNSIKRVFYNYYLRDMSIASIQLPVGVFSLIFGVIFGINEWWGSVITGMPATPGTVMLAAFPILFGTQFLLYFIQNDINQMPRIPLQKKYINNTKRL